MSEASPRLSVVVCSWHPTDQLRRCLESLTRQDADAETYEILVVDNSPDGRVGPWVKAYASTVPVALRDVREPELGSSVAKNRGVAYARGAIIGFVDSDARPAFDWVRRVLQAYDEVEEADAIGGCVILEGIDVLPPWWCPSFSEACSALDYGPMRQRIGYPRYPHACNLSFRREVFSRIGGFSRQLGPVGHRHLDGEEFELCLRLERVGGAIVFDPAMRVYHAVPPARLSRRFVMHKGFYHGRSMAMIEASCFGRRFALWRSVLLRRNLVHRRHVALGCAGASSVEDWLAQRVAQQERGGLNVKLLAQGFGYGYQTFVHELWRSQESVVPPGEVVHDGG